VPFKKSLSSLLNPAVAFSEAQQQSIGTSPVTITLPGSPTTFVHMKNLHATNTVTVTWTPNGGSSNTVITLEPGGWIQTGSGVASTGGITALSVVASATATPIEYVLAA
jgi:hypothetical protein